MLIQPAVVAWKELVDQCRDTRALVSSTLYALMGPAIVLIVLIMIFLTRSPPSLPYRRGSLIRLASRFANFVILPASLRSTASRRWAVSRFNTTNIRATILFISALSESDRRAPANAAVVMGRICRI